MKILNRHVLLAYLIPFIVCLLAFTCMWIIYDLIERLGEFAQLNASTSDVLRYYAIQIPGLLPMLLPVSVLVAAISCTTYLVRSGELVAMLACGVGVSWISTPIIIAGMLTSMTQLFLECTVAPKAYRDRVEFLEELRAQAKNRERRAGPRIRSAVYFNQTQKRIWYLRRADVPTFTLTDVEILQMDQSGRDIWKIFAKTMSHSADGWKLGDAVRVYYGYESENLPLLKNISHTVAKELSETFTQVATGVYSFDAMDQQELRVFLSENANLSPVRKAPYLSAAHRQLWSWAPALGGVLLVIGICLKSTRRSGLAGVGTPIAIYAGYVLVDQFFFALAKSARMPHELAIALPHMLWITLGAVLFYRRARTISE